MQNWDKNLLTIIQQLHGHKSGERRRMLVDMAVDMDLWEHIQALFTQEGAWTEESKEAIKAIVMPALEKMLNG